MRYTKIYIDNGHELAVQESCDEIRKLVNAAWPTSLKRLTRCGDGAAVWVKPWHICEFEEVEV